MSNSSSSSRTVSVADADAYVEPVVARRPGTMSLILRQPVTMMAFGWIVLLCVMAVLAPLIAPYDPGASNVMRRLQGLSSTNLLGTDDLGRDLLSRVIWGSRVAVLAVAQPLAMAAIIGIPIGLFVAYKGGWWERVTMRFVEVEQAIPMLLLAFTAIAIFGRGLSYAMIAVGIGFAMSYLRLTRAVVLAERQKPYVQAAEAQGYPTSRILFRHILPNAAGPLAVQTSILAGIAILLEAMLSFLGLGVPAGTPSWGAMLDDARRFQVQQPLLSLVPGVAITVTVLAFNLIGDGVRDAINNETTGSRKARRVSAVPAAPKATSDTAKSENVVLDVAGLDVEFPGSGGGRKVVQDLSFSIGRGEIYGLVGESGSGKSMTTSAILGMVPHPGRIAAGSITLGGTQLVGMPESKMRLIRGREVGVVFQDPMMALSPVHTVGSQMIEGLLRHEKMSKSQALGRAAELLDLVGVRDARNRLNDYPHQFSGGMAQRAMIAASLTCNPRLLIADEPTTALDATVQKQVLELLLQLRERMDMSVLFITHDLGVVAQLCDRVGVMKLGRKVEEGVTGEVFADPHHAYTRQLIEARRALAGEVQL